MIRSVVLVFTCIFCIVLAFHAPVICLYAQQPTSAEIEDLQFIQNLFRDKIFTFAGQEADSFRENYPGSSLTPDVVFVQAQINVINGKFNKALKQYSHIINQHPDSAVVEDALYFTGALKLQLNEKQGLVFFDRLLARFPKSKYQPKIRFHKGENSFEEENWSHAESHFKSVQQAEGISDEMRLKTQHYLAWVYYFQGNLLLAKSMFFELLEADISNADKAKIAFQLGVDFQKKKRYSKAISWYEKQMKQWPDPTFQKRSRFWIAECYYLLFIDSPEKSSARERKIAIRFFTENLALKTPVSPLISRYHRGWLYHSLEMKTEAENDFAWLQSNDPKYAADLELTATRADFFENADKLSHANTVYIQALKHQKVYEIRNMLLISIIRNATTLKDCGMVLKWKKESDLSAKNEDFAEISYYAGRCHFENKTWKGAGQDFARIPLDTPYARAVFTSYLTVFRETSDLQGGLDYLTSVEKRSEFGDPGKNLLLKLELCLDLKQTAQAIEVMLRIEKEIPEKGKDPWFLLNIAKTADSTSSDLGNEKSPIHQYPLRKGNFYPNLALKYYQIAYQHLPPEDKETRLSILDILIDRYRTKKDYTKVVLLYRRAVKLVDNKQKQDELRFLVANILLRDLKQKDDALKELHKIHMGGNTEVNYKASYLLAELYIEEPKYIQAIKILEDLASQPVKNTVWFSIVHFRLGELYQTGERWEKAILHYDQVVKNKLKSPYQKEAGTRSAAIQKYLVQQKQFEKQKQKNKQTPEKQAPKQKTTTKTQNQG
jgi:tetratricopeptide (TPR) repeat protein